MIINRVYIVYIIFDEYAIISLIQCKIRLSNDKNTILVYYGGISSLISKDYADSDVF